MIEFVIGLCLAEANGQLGIGKLLELLKNGLELFLILLQTRIGGIHLHEGLGVFLKASRVVGDRLVDRFDALFLEIRDDLLGPHDRVHSQRLLSLPLSQKSIADPDREDVELEGIVDQVTRGLKLVEELQGIVQMSLLRLDLNDGHAGLRGEIVLDSSSDHRADGSHSLVWFTTLSQHRGLGKASPGCQITRSLGSLLQCLLGLGLAARLILNLRDRDEGLGLVLAIRELLDAPGVIRLGLRKVLLIEIRRCKREKDRLQRLTRRPCDKHRLEVLGRLLVVAGLKGSRSRLKSILRCCLILRTC